jgi:hypothetical protein
MNNEVQSILATLLAFDTTSRESNLEMIDYINRFLSGFGMNAGCSTMTTAKKPIFTPAWGRRGRGRNALRPYRCGSG